jgi:L-seryl-tRNA(Ser) seleniumtransferase
MMTPGGGSAPDEDYPCLAVELTGEPQALLARLREWETPIIGTIAEDRVLLNLATVLPEEIQVLRSALQSILG